MFGQRRPFPLVEDRAVREGRHPDLRMLHRIDPCDHLAQVAAGEYAGTAYK
jgi:hypothetical protein